MRPGDEHRLPVTRPGLRQRDQDVYLPAVEAAVGIPIAHLLAMVVAAAVDRDGVARASASNEVLIDKERAVVVVEGALATHEPG